MCLAVGAWIAIPALLLFAGCGGQVIGPQPRFQLVHDTTRTAASVNAATGAAQVNYHGGPLLANVTVVPIFWGADTRFQTSLTAFYANITNSVFLDWMVEYDTPAQAIGRGRGLPGVVDANAPLGHLSDFDVQNEIARLIDNHTVPAPDRNTLYAVHFAPGVIIGDSGFVSCQQFCAYHSVFQHGTNVYYSIVPDQGGQCANVCDVDGNQEHGTTSTAAHELAEAITDPDTRGGWYTDGGQEIGDLCTDSVTVDGLVVQLEWSNTQNNCIAQ
jgi:hypothetical protein